MMGSFPVGVTVLEQWAVHSDDGEIYRVNGDDRATAIREAGLLRQDPANSAGEPGAAVAHRFVLVTAHGETASGWRWNLGGSVCCA
jgi:hypothetical protein